MARHHFFCFVLIIFSHCNSVGKYRENISVGKIRRQFTKEYSLGISVYIYRFSGSVSDVLDPNFPTSFRYIKVL